MQHEREREERPTVPVQGSALLEQQSLQQMVRAISEAWDEHKGRIEKHALALDQGPSPNNQILHNNREARCNS